MLILLGSAALAAQNQREGQASRQEPYEFTVRTGIVNVSFTVTDKNGRPVTTLVKDDFVVLEEGQRQEIKYFSREPEQPLFIAIVFDKSKSVLDKFKLMREATSGFLNSILRRGKDKAMLISFDEKVQVLEDFTDEVERISRAIDSLEAVGGTSLFDAIHEAAQRLINEVGEGRKVIILVTDGEDTTSHRTLKEVLQIALDSDISIYAIGVKARGSLNNRNMRGGPVLEKLTEQTGGKAFFPSSEEEKLAALFEQVEDELRNQYSIGYVSSNRARDGRFRRIEIVVARGGDYKVHARKGYYAPSVQ